MNRLKLPAQGWLVAALAAGVLAACTEEAPTNEFPAFEAGYPEAGATTGGTGGPGSTGGLTGALPGGPGGAAGGLDAGGVVDSGAPASGVPCAIRKIAKDKCQACHSDPPVSTFMPLVTHAHWLAPASSDKTKKYFELAKTRINAASNPMPPVTSPQLTESEKTALNNWLNQGAPASSEACNDGTPDAGTDAGSDSGPEVITPDSDLTCVKMVAHAAGDKNKKFKVGVARDAYYAFGFQAPWQGMNYVQVLRPVIDNSKVLHHWLLYREPAIDGAIRETIGQHELGELLAGWAPGGVTMDFRKQGDISMELPSETYALELHYNSDDASAEDASGVEICGKKTATKNIASMSWVGYDQGGTGSYATGICLVPSKTWTGVCKPVSQEPIHLLFMVPHLHQTGRHLKSVINGPNGSRMLHDKPFDFNYQITYETDEVLMPGESITTTCTYSEPKCAGQATTQEMCYNFIYAYPKHALVDFGLEGTFIHGAGACLGQ